MGKKAQDPTVATYYTGLQFVCMHGPADSLNRVRVDKRTAWVGTSTGGEIYINAPELFGGKDREGGVVGYMDVDMGLQTQTPNAYLESVIGTSLPAWRGLVNCIFKHGLVGNNYYLKGWQFEFTRIHKRFNGTAQWQDSLAEVPTTTGGLKLINGIHVIRECLTDIYWGYGYSELEVDETSFLAAAQTCYNEGLGFGFLWENDQSMEEFLNSVLDHVQGHVYRSRIDNKWHVTLVRKLTSLTGLLLLNEDNCDSVSEFRRKLIGDLVSSVTVKFLDNSTYEKNTVTITDIALTQRQSAPIVKNLDYAGVTCTEVAQKIAIRESRALGVPLYSCTIKCNLAAENLHPGDAFQLSWSDYLNDVIVMRVLTISLGTPTNQAITITAVQDSFHAADLVYTVPVASSWIDPINIPAAVSYQVLSEAPYYVVAKEHGDSFAQGTNVLNSFLMIGAVAPTADSYSAGVWSKTTGSYSQYGYMDFCFSGLLTVALDRIGTTITLGTTTAVQYLSINSFIQIGAEYLQVTAISLPTLTVIRGVLDTVPETHSIGNRVYGIGDFHSSDNITYLVGETVYTKLTTLTPKGELALASASEVSKALVGRMHLPYPPANLKINSTSWPSSVELVDLSLTWASRNRLQQTAGLIGYYVGNITSETGITYNGTLIRTDTSATLLSFTGETGLTRTLDTLTALPGAVTSITYSGTTATVTMDTVHGLTSGRRTLIGGASDGLYNGSFTITVVNTTVFTYVMSGTPSANASGTLTASASIYAGNVRLTVSSINANGSCLQPVMQEFALL